MQQFSLKDRISYLYLFSAALLVSITFLVIYQVVSYTVYFEANNYLNYEVEEYSKNIIYENNKISVANSEVWEQFEHNEVAVNPVFVELYDAKGNIVFKSENLKKSSLKPVFNNKKSTTEHKLRFFILKQIQIPIIRNNKTVGYLLVAIPLNGAKMVLNNLNLVLWIAYLLVLAILFFVGKFIAGSSIKPINDIINTSNNITNENLHLRIDLPKYKDELYVLSSTINELLDRLQNTVDREKKFTSDASHELRTPLAVIKGTLEVLIRKERKPEEYNQKINFCITEVDKMNVLVDQLLMLARFENQKESVQIEKVNLNEIVLGAISKFDLEFENKNLTVIENSKEINFVSTDLYLLTVVFHNLVSNAIKYSKPGGNIVMAIYKKNEQILFDIQDFGIGISESELPKIFDSFYRASNTLDYQEIKGTGLGLSITKRLCDLLNIEISVNSEINQGTTFTLAFNQ